MYYSNGGKAAWTKANQSAAMSGAPSALSRSVWRCLAWVTPGLWTTARGPTILSLRRRLSARRAELLLRDMPLERTLLLVVRICAEAGAAYAGLQYFLPLIPPSQSPLVADDLPTPANACSGRNVKGHLLMIFRGDAVIGYGNGPFTPVSVGACTVLEIARKGPGLVVNAIGYDSAGDLAWRLRSNQFTEVLDSGLAADRPDTAPADCRCHGPRAADGALSEPGHGSGSGICRMQRLTHCDVCRWRDSAGRSSRHGSQLRRACRPARVTSGIMGTTPSQSKMAAPEPPLYQKS